VKKRVWLDADNPKKVMAYDTLFYALDTILRCLNIFTPFLGEYMYQHFLDRFSTDGLESINMTEMPQSSDSLFDSEIEAAFHVLQELRSVSSHARNKKGVKLRHPVAKVMLIPTSDEVGQRALSLSEILLEDLNTRQFEVLDSDVVSEFIDLKVKPNYQKLGPKYKDKMKDLVRVLQETDANKLRTDLQEGEAYLKVGEENLKIELEDVDFEESLPEYLSRAESRIGDVYVDLTRTQDLEAEGLVRDVTRRVQVMRKELDLDVDKNIDLLVQFSDDESLQLAKMYEGYLSNETRSDSTLLIGPQEEPEWNQYDHVKTWEIDDLEIKVGMTPR
jgi:isoleucyl-tRNA synthetase